MTTLRSSSFLRLFVLPFVLSFWVSACSRWVDLEPPYGPAIKAAQTDEWRVTANGQRMVYESSLAV
ncbi:MAG TPA: hypothetical protein VLA33_07080, partial [Gemmatimonadota bacterium]|nr:hypothetical protein [Gemmatimonadota bacterium]